MADLFTVDASVFLNAFNERETDHAVSKAFLARLHTQAIPTISPTLLLPEVAAAISRGSQDEALATTFALTLSRLPHLVLVSLDKVLAEQAVAVAAKYRLRGSDAVYAAVALRFGAKLVTLDREQLTRVAPVLATIAPAAALSN
jgi:predicted nucleic acid-binding protein